MIVRLYLDEHVPARLASHLRHAGYDVLTTAEAGRANQKLDDDDQLAFAAAQGRVLLTFNHRDFAPIDARWKALGREHCGIILCPELPVAALCQRVETHLRRYSAEQHHNLLLWC